MKNKMKKFMAFVCAIATLITTMFVFPVNATEEPENIETDVKGYGLDIEAEDEYYERVTAPKIASGELAPYRPSASNSRSTTVIPSSCDNSTSPYFPAIGDQGETNSCVAFATTYYQFTYEANKLKNIVTTPANTCSPQWTYSHINYGVDQGSDFEHAYHSLKSIGSIRYDDYEPGEIDTLQEFVTHWSTNIDAAIEAMGIKGVREEIIFGEFTTASKPSPTGLAITFDTNTESDHYLDGIKSGLANGDIYVFESYFNYNEMNASSQGTHAGEKVAVRSCFLINAEGELLNRYHALTIVGYDDNVCVDVNGDGVIESAEKGAFKVANSWGTEWGNNGYIWVLYDALNEDTQNSDPNWEEDLDGSYRQPFICYQEVNNINVYENTNEIFVIFDYKTDYKFNIDVYTSRTETGTSGADYLDYLYEYAKEPDKYNHAPFDGQIVLDYAQSLDTIEDYFTGSVWSVHLYYVDEANHNTVNSTEIRDITYIDKNRNVIKGYTGELNDPIYSPKSSHAVIVGYYDDKFDTNIDLNMGDVNYDGVIDTGDETLLKTYISGTAVPSTLQKFLGDLNGDGELSGRDSFLIKTLINSQN